MDANVCADFLDTALHIVRRMDIYANRAISCPEIQNADVKEYAKEYAGGITLSRLGDEIRAAREQRGLTLKELAKKAGVAEKMLLEVENGKRIVSDEQAGRFLKAMGIGNIATDQEDDQPQTVYVPPQKPRLPPTQQPKTRSEPAVPVNEVWESALTTILQRVPVYDTAMQEVGFRMLPLENGKIAGAQRDKVFYLQVPDDTLGGFRILHGDLLLMLPVKEMPSEGIMLIKIDGQVMLRKLKKLGDGRVQLSVHDRTAGGLLQHQTVERAAVVVVAIAKRVEFDV